jgi:hypothetical protein
VWNGIAPGALRSRFINIEYIYNETTINGDVDEKVFDMPQPAAAPAAPAAPATPGN